MPALRALKLLVHSVCFFRAAAAASCSDGALSLLILGDQNPQLQWNCKQPECESWTGVACDRLGDITELNLANTGLMGTLAAEWSMALPKLLVLNLSSNSLTGTLPPQWKDGFEQLQTLDLSSNNISGSLPGQWKDGFDQLQNLNLSSNSLTGVLPATWKDGFMDLEVMAMSNNSIHGLLPPEWRDGFGNLQELKLNINRLGGTLPANWKDGFQQLQQLMLYNNTLTGPLPVDWYLGFQNLTFLHLTNNNLSGTLPTVWSNGFKKLKWLHITNNLLTGTLPLGWGQSSIFPALQELMLRFNNLIGTLPTGWSDGFEKLMKLHLSGNLLTGTIPPEWGQSANTFPALEWLELDQLDIEGVLPADWYRGFKNLTSLKIGRNKKLTGSLPDSWAQGFQKVKQIIISYNNLTGPLPKEWGAAGAFLKLTRLDLSHNNNMSSPLPEEWAQGFPSLVRLKMLNTSLVGTLPGAWANGFKSLEVLLLEQNQITGTLPTEWVEGFEALKEMYLGSNNVTGTLPEEWGEGFMNLTDMGMFNNRLTGSLPAAWAYGPGLQQVIELDFEANYLSGTVPESWQKAGNADQGFPAMEEMNLAENCLVAGQSMMVESNVSINLINSSPEKCATPPPPSGTDSSSSNTGLIVGLAVGIPILLAIAALAGCLLIRSLKTDGRAQKEKSSLAYFAAGLPVPEGLDAAPLSMLVEDVLHTISNEEAAIYSETDSSGKSPRGESGVFNSPMRAATLPKAKSSVGSDGTVPLFPLGLSSSHDEEIGSYCHGDSETAKLGGDLLSSREIREAFVDPEAVKISKDEDGQYIQLGRGATSQVYQGMYNGVVVALKFMTQSWEISSPAAMKRVLQEIAMLRHTNHNNILAFHGAAFTQHHIVLVFDYMSKGDLFNAMHAGLGATQTINTEYLWYKRGRSIALGIAEALKYLHGKRIVHCDIKSSNILVDDNYMPKVGDLGMSKIMAKDLVTKGGDLGTYVYAAPELLTDSRISNKVDVYSFGIIMWELVTGEVPMRDLRRPPNVPEECPKRVVDIIAACLHVQHNRRPSAAQLCELLKTC